jgi:hypothetical protein
MKYDILSIFQKYVEKNVTRVTGTLHEDRYMFFILSPSVLLRMINVAGRVVEKVKTHTVCMFCNFFFTDIHCLRDNVVRYSRGARPHISI